MCYLSYTTLPTTQRLQLNRDRTPINPLPKTQRLQLHGDARDQQVDPLGEAGQARVGVAEQVAEQPGQAILRHDAPADLVGHDNDHTRHSLDRRD